MVTFAITHISTPHRVLPYIYGPYGTISPRNFNHDNLFAFNFLIIYHIISQDVDAYLLSVIHHIPKVAYQFVSILNTFYRKRVVILFHNSKQDNTSFCIGK